MRIAIFGGHGKIARRLEPLLVQDGHEVDAIIRNPAHEDEVAQTGARPVLADVEQLDIDGVVRLLEGVIVAIWSAGAGGGNPQRTYAVDRDAAIRSMDAAAQAGVSRYLMVSYFGAGPDHGVPEDAAFFPYADAKAAADAHLRESGLAWTILAPSRLTTEEPTGRIEVPGVSEGVDKGEVSRADVAEVIRQTVARPGLAGVTVEFNNGATPIEEALDAVQR
ncbi:SDR family oxidoreductase [Ornithinicoccus halotolerans]|uniref:SDR family oxidoreductase n=1 Tax=Ornithinicoccus halotolerans TaxID=1748220 RepID=UPI00129731FB|nr:SDR family oxidoreductase [Ornithinicoccus halotolerans]